MITGEMHYRSFPLELRVDDDVDGLTVSGVVVPYGQVAAISEVRADGVISYRERFARGAFERITRPGVAHRVTLTYNHDDRLASRLGYGAEFAEHDDGLHGVFRLDRSTADKARDVLTGSHGGFSVGFLSIVPRPLTERAGELVTRRSAHLDHVAAVATPAYAGAGVASIRAGEPGDEPTAAELEAEQQRERDAELLAWMDAEADRWAALRSEV